MRCFYVCCLGSLVCLTAGAAQTSTDLKSGGACSPNIVSNSGTITITCQTSADKATVRKLTDLLNQLISKQDNSATISSKLDEILQYIRTKGNPNAPIVTYDLYGSRRVSSPGKESVHNGERMGAFQSMTQLQKSGDWNGLLQVAKKQRQEAPEWLTPIYFQGLANCNLCDLELAKMNFEELLRLADDSESYAPIVADARKILDTISHGVTPAQCMTHK
jgi:hypothetical protein